MAFYKLYKKYTSYTRWMDEFDEIMRPEVYEEYRRILEKGKQKLYQSFAPMYRLIAEMNRPFR